MIVYATESDLQDWTGVPPDSDHSVALRKASRMVGSACRCDMYYTQPDGRPSDDDLREAMRDATCAQVEAWDAADVNPATEATREPILSSTSIDGASVNYDTSSIQAVVKARSDAVTGLCDEAIAILRDAGLASAAV